MNFVKGRIFKVACFCSVFVVLNYFIVHQSPSQSQNAQPPTAFTAYYTEISTNPASGRSIQKGPKFWASRSDGATSTGWLDQRYGQRTVRNRNEKRETKVSDPLKLKTTYDYSYIPYSLPPRAVLANCAFASDPRLRLLGVEKIAGYPAYHYSSSSRTTLADQWFAPDLNCYEIQTIAHRYDDNGLLTGVFERKVTDIRLGEPESGLFAIPDDYREVTESEREMSVYLQMVRDREGAAAAAKPVVPPTFQGYLERLDAFYDQVKAKQYGPIK